MESYNPLKRKGLEPEETSQSKYVKPSDVSDQSIQLSTPTCDPGPALDFDDEQCRAWAEQLLEVQEDSNATENNDSQNNEDLLSIDDEMLPLSSNNENNATSSNEINDMQYIEGYVNSGGARLFREDLITVIKEFEKNHDAENARKYRDLLHQASREYNYRDIIWLTTEKIGFKATEEEIQKHYTHGGILLGQFISFCDKYEEKRRETVQRIPVEPLPKVPNQSNEPKKNQLSMRMLNYTKKAQHARRDLSSVDDTQYIKGYVNAGDAQLFREDLITVIKEFEKNHDAENARKYRILLQQASCQYGKEDIVWFCGEKIGFKATEEEIKKHSKSGGNPLGRFNSFCTSTSYQKMRRKIILNIPYSVKKSNQPNESVDLVTPQLGLFHRTPPVPTTQTEPQDANSLQSTIEPRTPIKN